MMMMMKKVDDHEEAFEVLSDSEIIMKIKNAEAEDTAKEETEQVEYDDIVCTTLQEAMRTAETLSRSYCFSETSADVLNLVQQLYNTTETERLFPLNSNPTEMFAWLRPWGYILRYQCILSHMGIMGNKRADSLASSANSLSGLQEILQTYSDSAAGLDEFKQPNRISFKVGSVVYQLRGIDSESSNVHYSISGEQFTVDRSTGVVTLLRPLDREDTDLIEVIISITDEGIAGSEPNTVSLRREISVIDVNDNAPLFHDRPYSFVVPETTRIGAILYSNVTLSDADGGVNSDIMLTCVDHGDDVCQTFDVAPEKIQEGQFIGIISLLKPLDFEQYSSYTLVLKATDLASDPSKRLTAIANIAIEVKDIQDQAPIFLNSPYSVTTAEGSPPGTSIFTVKARDGDVGDPRKVVLSLEEDHLNYFSLVPVESPGQDSVVTTAHLVTSNNTLDREHPDILQSGGIYTFKIKATEMINNEVPGDETTSQVIIVITDIDDQVPTFNQQSFNINVSEDIGVDTPLPGLNMVVDDKDVGENSHYSLKLRDVENSDGVFTIHPQSSLGRTPVVIKVADVKKLDYDVTDINLRKVVFDVIASMKGEKGKEKEVANSRVTVHLLDANDNLPQFALSSYRFRVSEDVKPGKLISNLSATDKDSGNFGKLTYAIKGFGAEKFSTDPVHGGLYVAEKSKGRVEQREGDQRLTPDTGPSLSIWQAYLEGTGSRDFEVVDSFEGALRVSVWGDGVVAEGRSQELQNLPLSSYSSLFIATMKHTTPYPSPPYYYSRALRTRGRFKGYIMVGFCNVDTYCNTGFIGLDYESQISYSLTFEAHDGGGRVATVNLFVEVEDVNDNAPVFEESKYTRTVREGATSFEPQLFVRATDADGPDQGGGKIFYSIESTNIPGKFFVEPVSGEIIINAPVHVDDTPHGQYELVVHASDAGEPPLHTDVDLLIRVGVLGNQRPTFRRTPNIIDNSSSYSATIHENAQPGSNVVTVIATDPDGQDSLLQYFIANGAKDKFVIDRSSGQISVSPDANFDLETEGSTYKIVVLAVDAGTPIHETATTTVTVDIIDVNNKPPIFPGNPSTYTCYVSESAAVGTFVFFATADDPDTDAILEYSIIEPIRAVDRSGIFLKSTIPYNYKEIFKINSTSGEITVAQPLDHQSAAVIILTIQAKDLNAKENIKEQIAKVEISIYIQAYNDSNPIFTLPGWSISNTIVRIKIPEEQPVGTVLMTLTAKDPITSKFIKKFEQIESNTSVDEEKFVIIEVNSGNVILNKRLDFESLHQKSLRFQVLAISEDGSHNSELTVVMDVEDINDNSPEFSQKLYNVQILESSKFPEILMTIQATDHDSINNLTGYGTVNYLLSGENADFFIVNRITGIIQIAPNTTLDREKQSTLNFVVIAIDTPQGGVNQRKSIAMVRVEVLDVNDNAPQFSKPIYSAVVPENVIVDTQVTIVAAHDPDEVLSGQIIYEISDEGEANGLFQVNMTTGNVTTQRVLTGKGRAEPYQLIIRAYDKGEPPLFTDVILNVHIGDVFANDGVPIFIHPELEEIAQISENSSIGSPVFQVLASDPDDPNSPNGKIKYTFLNVENDANVFSIDSISGLITTSELLDREIKQSYSLLIIAQDQGDPPQQATRLLQVNVTDIDDNIPLFKRGLDVPKILFLSGYDVASSGDEANTTKETSYSPWEPCCLLTTIHKTAYTSQALIAIVSVCVQQTTLVSAITTISAPTPIISRTVDNKGVITVVKRLDRETTSEHLITVKCFKMSSKPPIHQKQYNKQEPSLRQVRVVVEDIDDNKPYFTKDNITIGVRLNVPVDTFLITLNSVDIDSNSEPISYTLVNTTFFSLAPSVIDTVPVPTNHNIVFQLDQHSGELRTAGNMLAFVDGYFELQVVAENSEDLDRQASTIVKRYFFQSFFSDHISLSPLVLQVVGEIYSKTDRVLTLDSIYFCLGNKHGHGTSRDECPSRDRK
ncbi:unnamed protein product [Timema podura]|uniref:Cadherin domain-containing protein n=1 Tax=Timema podura TaxID=61482 RepID=A0ABN7NLF9_TIMPD|nr:unnamed protein product [Timema podura]